MDWNFATPSHFPIPGVETQAGVRHSSPALHELPDRPEHNYIDIDSGLARPAQTANNTGRKILAEDEEGAYPKQCRMPNASDAISQSLIPLVTTVTAIGVLVIAVYLIRSWLRENDGPAASAHELLVEYREMHRRGELSDEEFRIIKGRMAPRIKGTSDTIRNDDKSDRDETGDRDEKSDIRD